MPVIRIGLDVAKNVFQAHGVDEHGQVVLRKQLRRSPIGNSDKPAPAATIFIHNGARPAQLGCLEPYAALLSEEKHGCSPEVIATGKGPQPCFSLVRTARLNDMYSHVRLADCDWCGSMIIPSCVSMNSCCGARKTCDRINITKAA